MHVKVPTHFATGNLKEYALSHEGLILTEPYPEVGIHGQRSEPEKQSLPQTSKSLFASLKGDLQTALRFQAWKKRPEHTAASARGQEVLAGASASASASDPTDWSSTDDPSFPNGSSLKKIPPTESSVRPQKAPCSGLLQVAIDTDRFAVPMTARCVSCFDEFCFAEMTKMLCSHSYCNTCLTQMFRYSAVVESLFPPRCCRLPIPVEQVQSVIGPDLTKLHKEKAIELNDSNRTYCSNQRCLRYILPYFISNAVAICQSCSFLTCAVCKMPQHTGQCRDVNEELLLGLAKKQKWQRCPSCHLLVELLEGCPAIRFVTRMSLILRT
ncbi:hypothetical protein N7485_000481 [Penicillium canescens]|nr:hypothetical protein N7485_000481 [Penicillium canescens]